MSVHLKAKLFLVAAFTALPTLAIYLVGAFLLWDLWPDESADQKALFFMFRAVSGLFFILSLRFISSSDYKNMEPKEGDTFSSWLKS